MNSIVFRMEPGTTEGLTLCSCQLLILRGWLEQQKTYSLSSAAPPPSESHQYAPKEPRLPSRHLCSLSPARLVVSKHIPLTSTPTEALKLKLVWTFSSGSSSSCLTPRRISAVLRLLTHPLLLICLSNCTK